MYVRASRKENAIFMGWVLFWSTLAFLLVSPMLAFCTMFPVLISRATLHLEPKVKSESLKMSLWWPFLKYKE